GGPVRERRHQPARERRLHGADERPAGGKPSPGRNRPQAEPACRDQSPAWGDCDAGHRTVPGRNDPGRSHRTGLPEPLRVAVLAGGRSSEHEVSLASGQAVREGLQEGGHEVVAVEVGRDGVWRADGEDLELSPGRGLLDADVAFPALHGRFGEDGTVQGLLECLDVAYVGSGVLASALCMDKVLFKELMAPAGIPQVDYRAVRVRAWMEDRAGVLDGLEPL